MQCIIFIGIPASGKSTFYKERFFRTHMRINLDMLRSRHREKILFKACLEAKQPLVIDNTNVTRRGRRRYILPTQEAGFEIVGYYFRSVMTDCIERNRQRDIADRVPDEAVGGIAKRLELPSYAEGFHQLYYVHMNDSEGYTVRAWQEDKG
jgi:predicted kinase